METRANAKVPESLQGTNPSGLMASMAKQELEPESRKIFSAPFVGKMVDMIGWMLSQVERVFCDAGEAKVEFRLASYISLPAIVVAGMKDMALFSRSPAR